MSNLVGAPPKYKTFEELQTKIDEYFRLVEGEIAVDGDGNPIFSKHGDPCYKIPPRPPTITGLALHLGLSSRQALINYQGRGKGFNDTITRAKTKIESYAEERLYDRDGQRGAEFNLKCNFGWKIEKCEEDQDEVRVRIVDDV